MDKASGRFSTRLNRSRWAATSNCLSNVAAFGTRHLLGHGFADAAHSSGRSGRSFRQLRAVQASHRKRPGTDRCEVLESPSPRWAGFPWRRGC